MTDRSGRVDEVNRWLDSKDIDQKKKKIYHRVDAHVASSAAFAEDAATSL